MAKFNYAPRKVSDMSKEITTINKEEKPTESSAIEQALVVGDLSGLDTNQRISYYNNVCSSLGLNPLTKPFDYIKLNGKINLYAKRDATDQLRKIHGISITIQSREYIGDNYLVTARASDKNGRLDESLGVVSIKGMSGESLANAIMKCETKAKRRVTLSICGLGMLDETELDPIPSQSIGGFTNGKKSENQKVIEKNVKKELLIEGPTTDEVINASAPVVEQLEQAGFKVGEAHLVDSSASLEREDKLRKIKTSIRELSEKFSIYEKRIVEKYGVIFDWELLNHYEKFINDYGAIFAGADPNKIFPREKFKKEEQEKPKVEPKEFKKIIKQKPLPNAAPGLINKHKQLTNEGVTNG